MTLNSEGHDPYLELICELLIWLYKIGYIIEIYDVPTTYSKYTYSVQNKSFERVRILKNSPVEAHHQTAEQHHMHPSSMLHIQV